MGFHDFSMVSPRFLLPPPIPLWLRGLRQFHSGFVGCGRVAVLDQRELRRVARVLLREHVHERARAQGEGLLRALLQEAHGLLLLREGPVCSASDRWWS